VKDQLESLIGMMVERGILLEEAVGEFEKKFIKRVLERYNGNQSRAATASPQRPRIQALRAATFPETPR
jgi:DNA-binding NtrC family response regulator